MSRGFENRNSPGAGQEKGRRVVRAGVPVGASRDVDGPVPLLYVGGIGRSGSTLLERMLGEVPGVCSLGEVVHLWERGLRNDERCGCGKAFSACPFWREVGQRAFGGWANVSADRMAVLARRVDDVNNTPALLSGVASRSFTADLRAYAAAYARVYTAARSVSGARLVVDSSKHTSLALVLRRSPEVDLRLLHLIRDSRGVAYSWTKAVRRPEVVEGESYMAQFSPARIAFLWNVHNLLLQLPRLAGTPTELVRYEDFAGDPAGSLRKVLRFAGLAPEDDELRFLGTDHGDLSLSHQVAGNPMRFTTGRIELRRDDAWRTRFALRDQRKVAVLTAPVAAAFGYRPGAAR
jgi:hypothetical protein